MMPLPNDQTTPPSEAAPVVVHQVSKSFQQQTVVHQLSFQAVPGQILGFLGPNGAGKSTTMKMLTGYLKPSAGHIQICGYDVHQHPQQAKQHIGYLPEHNPLYLEMYVHEYLQLMGRIRGLEPKQCVDRSQAVVVQCGITAMQNKKIKTLSKGYRQRVGLAQALIYDPAVLILDEPTTGLDPNQLREIRALIKEVSRNKVVILSTHIMQEVEALCDQVLVMDHGKRVIHDTLARLAAQSQEQLVVVFKEPVSAAALAQLEGVSQVEARSAHEYIVCAERGQDLRATLFHFAQDHALTLLGLAQQKNSLEDLFQQLTEQDR